MISQTSHHSEHGHTFGQDRRKAGETRTLIVIAIAGCMMSVEIVAGMLFGSMALLADGLHMATHTLALAVSAGAYVYARKHAEDPKFSYGTGKVNALAGFASALLLAVFAAFMLWESVERFFNPVTIIFNQSIFVATVGLVVNVISAFVLNPKDKTKRSDGHDHGHDHVDHNLRSAYLHVVADALTSILAIIALVMAKFFGFTWMDPAMGIVGAALVGRWSVGLLKGSARVLIDHQADAELVGSVRDIIESDGDSILDLHVWPIGSGMYAASISLVTVEPKSPEHYKNLIECIQKIAHTVVEVHLAPL